MAEVDSDVEELLESLVMLPEYIIVSCHGEPFRVAFLDTKARLLYFCDCNREYLFNECDTELAVGDGEEYSRTISPRNNEIRFRITNSPTLIDD